MRVETEPSKDAISPKELEAIGLVSMQARHVQIMVARDLRHRFAGGDRSQGA
jgi:hypothetical protein